jgi:hypothetical protein
MNMLSFTPHDCKCMFRHCLQLTFPITAVQSVYYTKFFVPRQFNEFEVRLKTDKYRDGPLITTTFTYITPMNYCQKRDTCFGYSAALIR